jgi:integrase/recombinase XerD
MEDPEVKWKYYPLVAQNPAARAFIERQALQGKRPNTVDAYARSVEDLLLFFTTTDPARVLEADEAELDRYLAHLKEREPRKRGQREPEDQKLALLALGRRHLSDNTIAQRVVACRLFYDFLIRKRLRSDPTNPIGRGHDGRDGQPKRRGPVRRLHRLPWLPSDQAWEAFLRHVLFHEDTRTQAMILLAYDAALRREELMLLRVQDIDWDRGLITIRPETTKNGQMRFVPVSAAVLHLVRHYIEGDRHLLLMTNQGQEQGPLFLSESTRNPGLPLTVGAFDEIMQRVRARVNLPDLTPHTLRHQRCTLLKRAGVNLDDIALFAGHKSTMTTRLYIHLAPTELSKRIQAQIEPFDASLRALIEQFLSEGGSHDQ